MSEIADKQNVATAEYQLAFEPDGTSFMIRENLVDILERELLGPIHGLTEVLPFSPRSQYLVGLIAPVKLTTGKAVAYQDDEIDSERGHLIEARAEGEGGRGVPASGADETEAEAEGDDPDDRAPKQGLIVPASMGLRFQVPSDLDSFTVTASWGSYETVETNQVTNAGRPIRHFQRTPVEETRTIRPGVDRDCTLQRPGDSDAGSDRDVDVPDQTPCDGWRCTGSAAGSRSAGTRLG